MERFPNADNSNTALAIQRMLADQFTSGQGDRPQGPNVAVVLSGSCANQQAAVDQARVAQNQGIRMFRWDGTNGGVDIKLVPLFWTLCLYNIRVAGWIFPQTD